MQDSFCKQPWPFLTYFSKACEWTPPLSFIIALCLLQLGAKSHTNISAPAAHLALASWVKDIKMIPFNFPFPSPRDAGRVVASPCFR